MTQAIRERVAEGLREEGYELRNEAAIEEAAYNDGRTTDFNEGDNLVKRLRAEYMIRAADLLDKDKKKVSI